MALIALKTFKDETVVLTGNVYVDCNFEDCKLHVRPGSVGFRLDGCTMVDCVLIGDWHPEFLVDAKAKSGAPVDRSLPCRPCPSPLS